MQQFKHYFAHMVINFKNEILACACLDTSGEAKAPPDKHTPASKNATNLLHKVKYNKQITKFILARMQQNGI